jgi:hypothetical protein
VGYIIFKDASLKHSHRQTDQAGGVGYIISKVLGYFLKAFSQIDR